MRPSALRTSTPRHTYQEGTPRSCARLRSARGSISTARYSPYPRRRAPETPGLTSRILGYDPDETQDSLTAHYAQEYSSPQDTARQRDVQQETTQEESVTAPVNGESRPGRKPGPIWRHFQKLGTKTHPPVECLGCHKRFGSGLPKRTMVPHALKCEGISLVDKHFIRRQYGVPDRETAVAPPQPTTPAATPSVPEQAPAGATSAPNNTPLTQAEFELMVACLWFMCALPFVLVESPILRLFFLKLVPHLKLPSRFKLANVLLPKNRAEIEVIVIEMIKLQGAVTVTTDGYTDNNSCSIINFMVTAPGMKSTIWSCLYTGSIQHTAEYLAKELERVVNEVQTKTGAMVTRILTDNAEVG